MPLKTLEVAMDLEACHANGCPLDLDGPLEADKFYLVHDYAGIRNHMDRSNWKLDGKFLPRYR